jgi:hypothetical protein
MKIFQTSAICGRPIVTMQLIANIAFLAAFYAHDTHRQTDTSAEAS